MRLAEHLKALRLALGAGVVCLAEENPTCSAPAFAGMRGFMVIPMTTAMHDGEYTPPPGQMDFKADFLQNKGGIHSEDAFLSQSFKRYGYT